MNILDYPTSVPGVSSRPLPSLRQLSDLFSHWPKHRSECLTRLGPAHHHVMRGSTQLGATMLGLLKNEERLAEADELLEILLNDAKARGDDDALARYQWDRSWIWGHWGEPYLAPRIYPAAVRETSQLGFLF